MLAHLKSSDFPGYKCWLIDWRFDLKHVQYLEILLHYSNDPKGTPTIPGIMIEALAAINFFLKSVLGKCEIRSRIGSVSRSLLMPH